MTETWEVRRTQLRNVKTDELETVFVCVREIEGNIYYFNYAYDEVHETQAISVMQNLKHSKIDRTTDLAFNYVHINRVQGITKRTSQHANWYIVRGLDEK